MVRKELKGEREGRKGVWKSTQKQDRPPGPRNVSRVLRWDGQSVGIRGRG
jgi:hypothetical protein